MPSVLRELPRLAKAVMEATGADGYNIVQNNGKAAGQMVPHAHFHVIPRKTDDKLITLPASASEMIAPEVAAKMVEDIQGKLE